MPRKKRVYKNKKYLKPDPKFGNMALSKFINYMMYDGKKSVSQRIIYDALDIISDTTKNDPLVIFDTALKNVAPVLEVKARRVGGANYQIAQEVRPARRDTLSMRWLRDAARGRGGKGMAEKLAAGLSRQHAAGGTVHLGYDVSVEADGSGDGGQAVSQAWHHRPPLGAGRGLCEL